MSAEANEGEESRLTPVGELVQDETVALVNDRHHVVPAVLLQLRHLKPANNLQNWLGALGECKKTVRAAR
jgi:hypothetical protein